MKQKNEFTIEEHRKNAVLLSNMRHNLIELLIRTGKRYGVSSKEVKAILGAKLSLERLRCVLDSDIMLENPNVPIKELNFYYRGKDDTI